MASAVTLHKPALKIVPNAEESFQLLLEESQIAAEVMRDLTNFVQAQNDDYLNVEPWFIFNAWMDQSMPRLNEPNSGVFQAWQMFHWTPTPDTVKSTLITPTEPTIAAAYLKRCRASLSEKHVQILESGQKNPLDLYEIVGINGQYLTLYGLISRKKTSAYHPELSSKSRMGEYLLAAILPIDQMRAIFLGASQLMSRQSEPQMREFCRFLDRCEKTSRVFKSFESDVFNLFYDLNSSSLHN